MKRLCFFLKQLFQFKKNNKIMDSSSIEFSNISTFNPEKHNNTYKPPPVVLENDKNNKSTDVIDEEICSSSSSSDDELFESCL